MISSAGANLDRSCTHSFTTGRFTSPDPFAGGNEDAYDYPDDPINMDDLTGHKAVTKAALLARVPKSTRSKIAREAAVVEAGITPLGHGRYHLSERATQGLIILIGPLGAALAFIGAAVTFVGLAVAAAAFFIPGVGL